MKHFKKIFVVICLFIEFVTATYAQAPVAATAIDLALPSGTRWANMNVGAEKTEDYGLFFAWGETVGYGSDVSDGRGFSWGWYKWSRYDSRDYMTKYTPYSYYGSGPVDYKSELDMEDDAAYINWGGEWRMPTFTEIKELIDNTTQTLVSQNGVSGQLFTSKINGNSIFLPASGIRQDNRILAQGTEGIYWSRNLSVNNYDSGGVLNFTSTSVSTNGFPRCDGIVVRPVTSTGESGISSIKNNPTENILYYDLQGRFVKQPTRGIYIINNKKVFIK